MPRNAFTDGSDWGCDMHGRDLARRAVSRRAFFKGGAMALVGTSVIPSFLVRSVMAEVNTAASRKKLVVIFQRGAADGLNVVVPHGEPNYYAMRPTIAIQKKDVLDLNGFFGLHPALASFKPLYEQGHLAIIPAAGSPDSSRSHFDAQDYMESGTPGVKTTQDGWLNRALQDAPPEQPASAFRAVALGPQVPRTLQGRMPAIAVNNVADFSIGGKAQQATNPVADTFAAMYDGSSDTLLHGTGQETFQAIRMLKEANPARYQPAAGVDYPRAPFGNSLKQIAQLFKANLGVEAAFTDIGGWDTHQNQGNANGQLANRLREFSDSIAAFWQDMGDAAENITLVTMSEFGRTAHQNGTGGTDHGHGNVMFVLGGQVRGGKIYGRWPGLSHEQLNEGRDLTVTTDFRNVLGEAAYKTLGSQNLEQVFPGTKLDSGQFLNFV